MAKSVTNDIYVPHDADFVIEAIVESLDAKTALFGDVQQRAPAAAVLATNTSSIPLADIAAGMDQPERLVGIHFFNPVARMQLVEVVHGPATRTDVAEKAAAFCRHIGRLPLPVRSAPGFLVNRILTPYLLEATAMLAEGIPAAFIDRVAVDFGMPMGPVELADSVGLDICLQVAEVLSERLDTTVPQRLRDLVSQGRLGRKSGAGFYRYRKGKAVKEKLPHGSRRGTDVIDRMMLRLLNEVVACLREGVVTNPEHLDAGMVYGTGFAPFRGGPLHYIQTIGADTLFQRLQNLEERFGPRFTPDAGWELVSGFMPSANSHG